MHSSGVERLASWSDTLAARFARPRSATSVFRPGLPRGLGSVERGTALLQGRFRIGGELVELHGASLWDAVPRSLAALRAAHGFSWLDDLASVPAKEAEALAATWVTDWIERFGTGRGPGWTADLAGQRALRLVHHGELLARLPLSSCLARHAAFLERRGASAPSGLPRVEALAGLFHAVLAMDPLDERADLALAQIGLAADTLISPDGGVASRSPEALARALLLLGWVAQSALENSRACAQPLTGAIARAAPVLRGLVQPDGGLPRFHGGRSAPGLADLALVVAGHRRPAASAAPLMGFARLRHGGTSVVLDAAPPPALSDAGHASTLAFEITVGRHPMIVSCGPGARFGPRWARAARATASHSTLSLDGLSSSRLSRNGKKLSSIPRRVRCEREETPTGTRIFASQDGYVPTHGLRHERILELTRDGRHLAGEDTLEADSHAERRCFDLARRRSGEVRFAIRFHLDTDIEPSLDMGGRAVSLLLPSGALWVFRATSRGTRIAVNPSVSLPFDTLEPVGSRQVVLFSSATEYATRIAWQFSAVPGTEHLY